MSGYPTFEVDFRWSIDELEKRLQDEFEHLDLIGELPLEKQDYIRLVKILRGASGNVPSAIFLTSMVFCARYSEENARNFWKPYRETVAACGRDDCNGCYECRNRFVSAKNKLSRKFGFEFPTRPGYNDVVKPVYYHAIIPAYLQDDLADWLAKKHTVFRRIARISIEELCAELENDSSLKYVPRRLKGFIHNEDTKEAAARLIQTLAEAALYLQSGESAEVVADLLVTPIERDIWEQLVEALDKYQEMTPIIRERQAPLRLQWGWDLIEERAFVRIQGGRFCSPPSRCVCRSADQHETSYLDVYPFKQADNSWVIDELRIYDIPESGVIEFVNEAGQALVRQAIEPLPDAPVLPFRLVENDDIGLFVNPNEAAFFDGEWLFCTYPDVTLPADTATPQYVPEGFRSRGYTQAFEASASFPLTFEYAGEKITLKPRAVNLGEPYLSGYNAAGLERNRIPCFSGRFVQLHLPKLSHRDGKTVVVLKRGNQRLLSTTISQLMADGAATSVGAGLRISIFNFLLDEAATYSIELFRNLKPVLPEPLEFYVVPSGMTFSGIDAEEYYHRHKPPVLRIAGSAQARIEVDERKASVESELNQTKITWKDFSQNNILLRLALPNETMLLNWPFRRIYAWVADLEHGDVLLDQEFHERQVHIRGEPKQAYTLSIEGTRQWRTEYLDAKGKSDFQIANHPLMDMLRGHPDKTSLAVRIQLGDYNDRLLTIQRRPDLSALEVRFVEDNGDQAIWIQCNCNHIWRGSFVFQLRSIANPADVVVIAQTDELGELFAECELEAGHYHLEILDDGAPLNISPDKTLVSVRSLLLIHSEASELPHPQVLFDWLTQSPRHLWLRSSSDNALVEALKTAGNKADWELQFGFLPAWAVTNNPIQFTQTFDQHRIQVRLIPQLAYDRGRIGRGYTELKPYLSEHRPLKTFASWRHNHLVLKVPDSKPDVPFAELDEDDLCSVYLCRHCGRFVGSEYGATKLTQQILRTHTHQGPQAILYDTVYGNRIIFDKETGGQKTRELDRKFSLIGQIIVDPLTELPIDPDYHPSKYVDRAFAHSVLERAGPMQLSTEFVPATADHYRYAMGCWIQRYHVIPAELQRCRDLTMATTSDSCEFRLVRSPAYAAYRRFSQHAFENERLAGDARVLELDQAVLLLAMRLRSIGHGEGVLSEDSDSNKVLMSAAHSAAQYCPELLAWALTWAELFFVHAV